MTKKFLNLRNVIVIAICLAVTTMFSSCDSEVENPDCSGYDDPIEIPVYDPVYTRFLVAKKQLEAGNYKIAEMLQFAQGHNTATSTSRRMVANGRTLPEMKYDNRQDSLRQVPIVRAEFLSYEQNVEKYLQPGLVYEQMHKLRESMGKGSFFTSIVDTTLVINRAFQIQSLPIYLPLWREINAFKRIISNSLSLHRSLEETMRIINNIVRAREELENQLNDIYNRAQTLDNMGSLCEDVARLENGIKAFNQKIDYFWSFVELLLDAEENATNP